MRGTFKTDGFDYSKLDLFIEKLQASGLEFTSQWKKGSKESDKESANFLLLQHKDKIFFQVLKKDGLVIQENLPLEHRAPFYQAIKEFKLYQKPDFTLGIILAVVFIAVYAIIISPELFAISETLAAVTITASCVSLFGIILLFKQATEKSIEQESGAFLPMLFIFPGICCFAPSSLLLFPLLKAILTLSHWSKIKQL